MENNNEEKKLQAQNLYYEANLTQQQIADIVGVSQKTVSVWMKDGRWEMMAKTTKQTPTMMIAQMNDELMELNQSIASREPGKRFPTKAETEVRKKIIDTIKTLNDKQALTTSIDVMKNFLSFTRNTCPSGSNELRVISTQVNNFINARTEEIEKTVPFKSFNILIPATEEKTLATA